MKLKTLLLSAATLSLPVLALAAPPSSTTAAHAAPAKPAEMAFHRIALTAGAGKDLPYSLEVPMGWEAHQVAGFPGLWIGPADAKPPEDPRLIWGARQHGRPGRARQGGGQHPRQRRGGPEMVGRRGSRSRTSAAVRGVLVQMNTGEGDKARSSLTLKLPLAKVSLDIVASATPAEFPQQLPLYERILLSARPTSVPAAK